jgi:Zn-dependent peptidase ImmA (M78 family)
MGWLYEGIIPYLCNFVELPDVNLPCMESGDPARLDGDAIETIASEVRRYWGLKDGPLGNIVWLLESNGTIVTREEFGAAELDSFSSWRADGRPYVFLNADKHSMVRSRFDAAHELGHLILHKDLSSTYLRNLAGHRLAEEQANRFASAFLLPGKTFGYDVDYPSLGQLRALKPKWLASIAAMLKRVDDLGFLSETEARHLWVLFGRRGWKRREPLDDELIPEEPRLKFEAFDVLVSQGIQGASDILASLPYSPGDIEDLAVLPRGYLMPKPPAVQLKPGVKGRLIQFPNGGHDPN